MKICQGFLDNNILKYAFPDLNTFWKTSKIQRQGKKKKDSTPEVK